MERILYSAGILYAVEAVQRVGTDDLIKAVIVIVAWIVYNLVNKGKKTNDGDK
jgi:ABC-type uncharacterized transport system permease subunit